MKYMDEKCAICGGQLIEKKVEKLLRGGKNMASVNVKAELCLHCGERFYTPETIEQFEKIELELEREKTRNFQLVGRAFQVAF
ncbi:Zinc finger domain-containing protein, MqsA-type [Candidatus Magnetomoraceae bacterium gMMP-1]